MRLIGLDPGLRQTGWGVIEAEGSRLRHIANGTVASDHNDDLARRLAQLYIGLCAVIETYRPESAAVEETFVNRNPASTLRLGMARGAVLLAPARWNLPVAEYSANQIKKSVVGTGHAEKAQIGAMVRCLLPGVEIAGADAADALAVAICHAHFAATQQRWQTPPPRAAVSRGRPA
jgi:crossover junction endodeoxyribonuclease RuvC